MKLNYKLLISVAIFSVFATTSCKKDFNNADALSNSQIDNAVAAYNPFGLTVMESASIEDSIHITDPKYHYNLTEAMDISLAVDYGVKYYRMKITHDTWIQDKSRDSFFVNFQRVNQNGMLAVLNVNWASQEDTPQPFANPTDYANFLSDVLDSLSELHYKPAIIVVENEEGNFTKHQIDTSSVAAINASCQKYIDLLAAAIPVCKNMIWWDGSQGIQLTDGGFTTRQLTYLTWDWLKNERKQPVVAKTFANNSMPPIIVPDLYLNPQPPYIKNPIAIGKFYTSKLATMDISFTNMHWYEPVKIRNWIVSKNGGTPWQFGISPDSLSRGSLDQVLSYLNYKIPKKVISNETGQLDNSAKLNKAMTDKYLKRPQGAFYIAVFFDGDGKGNYDPVAMHNTFKNKSGNTYTLRSNGLQFKQTNAGLK